jgi:hypothetical protein
MHAHSREKYSYYYSYHYFHYQLITTVNAVACGCWPRSSPRSSTHLRTYSLTVDR